MKERGILFSAPMVRALLAGTKTVTRRIVKNVPPKTSAWIVNPERDGKWWPADGYDYTGSGVACPYGVAGDRLWVRETWYCDNFTERDFDAARVGHVTPRTDDEIIAEWRESLYYRADTASGLGSCCELIPECMCAEYKTASGRRRSPWKPGIHMPRWASRLLLEVVSVRVERLQEITEADAKAEGVDISEPWKMLVNGEPGLVQLFNHRDAYAYLWNAINGDRLAWTANPWVWRVEFKQLGAMTLDEVKAALAAGAEERKAAEKTMKRSPRR